MIRIRYLLRAVCTGSAVILIGIEGGSDFVSGILRLQLIADLICIVRVDRAKDRIGIACIIHTLQHPDPLHILRIRICPLRFEGDRLINDRIPLDIDLTFFCYITSVCIDSDIGRPVTWFVVILLMHSRIQIIGGIPIQITDFNLLVSTIPIPIIVELLYIFTCRFGISKIIGIRPFIFDRDRMGILHLPGRCIRSFLRLSQDRLCCIGDCLCVGILESTFPVIGEAQGLSYILFCKCIEDLIGFFFGSTCSDIRFFIGAVDPLDLPITLLQIVVTYICTDLFSHIDHTIGLYRPYDICLECFNFFTLTPLTCLITGTSGNSRKDIVSSISGQPGDRKIISRMSGNDLVSRK